MLQGRGSIFIDNKEVLVIARRVFWLRGPSRRRNERQLLGRKGGKATSGNYSTVKSAQRFSATLSIRPSGRGQIIDM